MSCRVSMEMAQDAAIKYPLGSVEKLFPVTELRGIVLWDDRQSTKNKRYKLYEGNHRISAWMASRTPATVPALIFIGKPKIFMC
jgi:hypothetical protein